MQVSVTQILQLIKKPESGVNGTAVYEVPDKKANKPDMTTMSDRQKCSLFFDREGTSRYARGRPRNK